MNIDDMFKRILARSGQYIIKPKKLELDVDTFRVLVEDMCAEYSKHYPYDYRKDGIEVVGSRQYQLPQDFHPTLNRKPDWLSEVTPMTFRGPSFGSLITGSTTAYNRSHKSALDEDPIQAPWYYDEVSGIVTLPYSGNYYMIGVWDHEIEEFTDEDSGEIKYQVKTISRKDSIFFKMLQGKFLEGLGRSRRQFTMNDLPITMDAQELASEGDQMYKDALEDLYKASKDYLTFG